MPGESSDTGRKLVVRVVAVAITISVITIVTFNVVQGSGRLPQQAVRFALTLALCFFLVRGRPWARWLSAVLFLVAGVGSVGSLGLFGKSMGAWALLAMGVAYLYCAGVLLGSPSVRAFFGRARAPAATSGGTS